MPVIIEAFRRLLNTPGLQAPDLGWEDPGRGRPAAAAPHSLDVMDMGDADPWNADPITWLAHLGKFDMCSADRPHERRGPDRRIVLFSLAAAALPAAVPGAPTPPGRQEPRTRPASGR